MNFTDKRITDIEKRIDDIERFNKDVSGQTMKRFKNVLHYANSIYFEFTEFKKRLAKLEQTNDVKVEVPELPNILETERIKSLSLWYKYYEKYKIQYKNATADDFFK